MSTPSPSPSAPSWPYCAHGADHATDPVGCRGIHVPGHTACLAHLSDTDRDAYLAGLTPGANIDHRGTPFTEPLLNSLLHALRDPTTGKPSFGDARFDEARFSGDACFEEAQFSGITLFEHARFVGYAWFSEAQFSGDAWFDDAQFSDATFDRARFSGTAGFDNAQFCRAQFVRAQFSRKAWFNRARFSDDADFGEAQFSGAVQFVGAQFFGFAGFQQVRFSGDAWFGEARFSGNARFDQARFAAMSRLGPVVCSERVDLSRAVLEEPVTLEIAAREVRCDRTRWESTATLRLRYAATDLSHAVLSFPVAVAAHPAPFTIDGTVVDESMLPGSESGVRVVSARGVDAA